MTHNFWPTDLNRDGKLDLLLASFEGVQPRWNGRRRQVEADADRRRQPGDNAQATAAPARSSTGKLNGKRRLHRHDRAVARLSGGRLHAARGNRRQRCGTGRCSTISSQWGHAVWCADLDGDGDEELIIGVRDNKGEEHRSGVRIYDPQYSVPTKLDDGGSASIGGEIEWHRHLRRSRRRGGRRPGRG